MIGRYSLPESHFSSHKYRRTWINPESMQSVHIVLREWAESKANCFDFVKLHSASMRHWTRRR
jgi:hypothetical protein